MNVKTIRVKHGYRVDLTENNHTVSCFASTKQAAWKLALNKLIDGIKK